MSGTKLVIIVLVLVAVVFMVVVVWGAGNNGLRTSAPTFDRDAHPVISKLGDVFGPAGPKLKATEITPAPPPLRRGRPTSALPPGKFALTAGDQPTTFEVAADSKDQFRQATFTLSRAGCATVAYRTADGSGGKLSKETWPDDVEDQKGQNPTKFTFQVLSAKGFLSFTFKASDCTVRLE